MMITKLIVRRKFTCSFFNINSYSSCSISTTFHNYYSTCIENRPVTNPTVFDFLHNKHQFTPESATRLASVVPRLRKPEKSHLVFTFLKEVGFTNTHLEKIVKCRPSLISVEIDKFLKPKIKVLQDLGLSGEDIANIITNDPSIFYRSTDNRVVPSVAVLKRLLGSNQEVANVIRKKGWFLIKDLEKSMVPNVEFLKSCCVSMDQIVKSLYSYPRFLLHKPDIMRKYAKKVEEMGVRKGSKTFIHAVRVIGSMAEETWELKLQAFRDLGFSEDDILHAFRSAPLIFAVSKKKMKDVTEVVVSSGKYDIACIIEHPTSLICSIEKRYKPRLRVLRILESKNLIKDWPLFTQFFNASNKIFYEKFVGPYRDEIGDESLIKSFLEWPKGGKTRGINNLK